MKCCDFKKVGYFCSIWLVINFYLDTCVASRIPLTNLFWVRSPRNFHWTLQFQLSWRLVGCVEFFLRNENISITFAKRWFDFRGSMDGILGGIWPAARRSLIKLRSRNLASSFIFPSFLSITKIREQPLLEQIIVILIQKYEVLHRGIRFVILNVGHKSKINWLKII